MCGNKRSRVALNWLVASHGGFGCAWATPLPNQATAKEAAVNSPLQPNISTYYHKVIFVCLVPIKSCRPKSLEGRLTAGKMRTGHFLRSTEWIKMFSTPAAARPPLLPARGGRSPVPHYRDGGILTLDRFLVPVGQEDGKRRHEKCLLFRCRVGLDWLPHSACVLIGCHSNKASGGLEKCLHHGFKRFSSKTLVLLHFLCDQCNLFSPLVLIFFDSLFILL